MMQRETSKAKDAEHSVSISKLPPVTMASPKRDWADWGIWVFTLLLAATSVLQIWLLRRTLTYVRRQAHEMRHQRHEMWRQRKAMMEQVEIANRSLVAQFRPTIVVRSIKLNPSSTSEFDRYGEGNWTIDLYIVNVGQTEAHIKYCEATGFWRDGYPPTATQIGKAQWPEFSVQAGGRRKLNLPIEVENFRGNMSVLEHDAKNRQDAWPICSGKIIYRDDSGCIRETGFERVWQVGTQKFIASEDPELGYHD
jgi:hypothetical protein